MTAKAADSARREQLSEQLRQTCDRLSSLYQSRDRLIAQAHAAGLSLRKIAAATSLSLSRVHQVLRAAPPPTAPPQDRDPEPSAVVCSLKKIFLFSGLDKAALATLGRHAVLRKFPKQTLLIHEGDRSDSLHLLLSGSVQVYASDNDGREVLLCTLAAGDCVGELSLLDERPRSASVRTVSPCQILILSRAAFSDCLDQHPSVAKALLRTLAGMVRQDNDRTKGLALMCVYERLASVLQELGEQRDGVTIVDDITHQALAERVYASREMVTVILKDLRKGGYISTDNRRITIKKRLPAKW